MFTYQIDDEVSLAIPRPKKDATPLFSLVEESRSDLAPWLPWVAGMQNVADEEKFLRTVLEHFGKGTSVNLIIRYQKQVAGMISFNRFLQMDHSTEIGYWLDNKFKGHNIMHRAVVAMCELGFSEYDVHKIEIHAAIDNVASNHVAQKAGFHLDGMVRASELLADGFHDTNIWTLLKEEWEANH